MRFFVVAIIFASAFALGAVAVLTFAQPPFTTPVAARLLFYRAPALPVYWYVIGSFAVGLLLGLAAALWVAIRSAAKASSLRQKIHRLEGELAATAQGERGQEASSLPSNQLERLNASGLPKQKLAP